MYLRVLLSITSLCMVCKRIHQIIRTGAPDPSCILANAVAYGVEDITGSFLEGDHEPLPKYEADLFYLHVAIFFAQSEHFGHNEQGIRILLHFGPVLGVQHILQKQRM